jgi:hypothetical protein
MGNHDPQHNYQPFDADLLTLADNATELNALADAAPAAALTAQLTTITHTAPGTPDYAIQNLTATGGYGFVTADEGNSVLKVVANLQTRLAEVEARLKTLALIS